MFVVVMLAYLGGLIVGLSDPFMNDWVSALLGIPFVFVAGWVGGRTA
jgi:hypothetical protein